MGLDMYFSGKVYNAGGYDHMKNTPEAKTYAAILKALDFPAELAGESIQVEIRTGYLRKANAIHGWLVQNIQDGRDECQESYFDREKVTELRDICRRILATVEKGEPVKQENFGYEYESFPDLKLDTDLAKELLEPTQGFFFGSYDMDEYYVYDLEEAEKFLTRMLEHEKFQNMDFYYRASW